MKDNQNIFKSITHKNSGNELYVQLLQCGTYIETLELDGPKLLLDYLDSDSYIKNDCRIKENDELSVDMDDGNVSESRDFTVLAIKLDKESVHIECIASPTYNLKTIADKTKVFAMRGILQIIQMICQGLMPSLGAFSINNNYHVLAGERSSTMLRQVGKEQGADVWSARGKLNIEKFEKLYAKSPSYTFHHGQSGERNIISYQQPAGQRAKQEEKARTFTGWDEKQGRIKTAPNNPILKAVKSKPVEITGSGSKFALGTATTAHKTVISFVTEGDLALEPGITVSLVWHLPYPERPIDEGMPDKVVVTTVCHRYEQHQFMTLIKGDVPFSPA